MPRLSPGHLSSALSSAPIRWHLARAVREHRLVLAMPDWSPEHNPQGPNPQTPVHDCHTRSASRPTSQHLPRDIEILEMLKPRGAMLTDCLHADVVTNIAALKFSPWIERLKPLPVIRPDTEPLAE